MPQKEPAVKHAAAPGAQMEAELRSQPDTWARAADLRDDQSRLPARGERIAVIGCGTSWFMAQSYAAVREEGGAGVTDAYAASEAFGSFTAFAARDYDAVVALTRSGTTTEVLELLDRLRSAGVRARTIGVTGDPGTPLVDLVDDAILLPFADERSVVQTRFATTTLALARASLGHDLGPTIEQAVAAVDEELPGELITAGQYAFLGAGWTVGLAHEAALKMREASQSWTESYPAKEYRHGPIAIAAPGRVTWMLGSSPDGLADDVVATGARFEDRPIDGMADLVRAQRVALERARRAGLDPDRPRNLTRSVVLGS
jgi:fructoselysine-6-P-deglycase FrlB-like protein